MPRPIARDRNGVRHTVDQETGQWRPMTAEENGSIIPIGILDEQGVTDGERWTIKNLPPSAGLAMLKLKGYEAVQYGDGQNFAVRKSPEEPWKLVDPAKGGFSEFWRDMVDLLGDVAVVGATVAGTAAGGGLASIGTGAAAGAGAEAARQNIARAAGGLPPGIDLPEVAGSAIGGGIAPPVGRLVGGAVRGLAKGVASFTRPGGAASRAGEAFTTKLAGIKGAQGIEISDVLTERAVTMPQPFFTPEKAVGIFREHMDAVAKPSIDFQMKMLDKAIPKGATVSVLPFKRELRALIDIIKPSKELRVLSTDSTARLQERLVAVLQPPSRSSIAAAVKAANPRAGEAEIGAAINRAFKTWDNELRRTPAKVFRRLKQVIADEVADRKGFGTVGIAQPGAVKPPTDREVKLLSAFSKRLTRHFHQALPKSVVRIDKDASTLIRARNSMRSFFGAKPLDKKDPSVANILAAHKKDPSILRALTAYDRAFPGLGFAKLTRRAATEGQVLPRSAQRGGATQLARQATLGSEFTPIAGDPAEFGLPSPFGKFTATGGIFGASLVGGAIGGATGGQEGILPGLAAGAAAPFLFSPAGLVKSVRFLTRANARVTRMATGVDKVLATKMLREATAILGTAAAQSTGRRIASQDSKGRRRALFIGQ